MDPLKPVNTPIQPTDFTEKYNLPETSLQASTPDYLTISRNLLNQTLGDNKSRSLPVVESSALPSPGSRYPNYYVGQDNEEIYAQGQSKTDKAINGIAKFTGIATSTFIQGTAGLVYGTYKWAQDGKFSSFYDNDLSRSLNEWTEKQGEKYANYKTLRERNGDWWSPSNLFTGNFWWDNIVTNLGFSAGTLGGGFATAALLKSIGLTAALTGKGVQWASAAEEAITASMELPASQRLGSTLKNLEQILVESKGVLGKGLMQADRAIVATFGTVGEAGMEALNNSQEFRKNLIQNFTDSKGYAPNADDLKEIDAYAQSVGNSSFLLNSALLSFTNYVQLPKIFSSSFKNERSIVNNIARTGEDYASTLASKGWSKRLTQAKNITGLTFNPSEAFEEGSQFAIQTGTQNYFGRRYNNEDANVFDDGILHGIEEALTTSEGTLNIFIGGFSGALQQLRGNIKSRGIDGYGGQESKVRNEAIKALNDSKLEVKLKEAFGSLKAAQSIQQDRAIAIENGDILESKDLEFDYAHNFITQRVKSGSESFIYEEINALKEKASTTEGFLELQKEGITPSTDTQVSFTNRLNNVKTHAENVVKLQEALNLKYKGLISPETKERLYSDESIDKMIYAASKISNYDERTKQLTSDLLAREVLVDDLQDEEYFKNISKEIEDKETVTAEETIQKLKDLRDITKRRDLFVKEYKDIKENPEKYTTKKEKEIPKEDLGKTITIKNEETGEDEVLIVGEEYTAEKSFSVKETDGTISKFMKFKIVGQDPETKKLTVLIDGKTYYAIDPKNVAKYKLVKTSDIKTDNHKAYSRAAHLIFTYNEGKGALNPKGHITYDSAKDLLFFESLDGKKKKAITREDLKPQIDKKTGEKYDKAKVYTNKKEFSELIEKELNSVVSLEEKLKTRNQIIVSLYNENKNDIEKAKQELEEKKQKLVKLEESLKETFFTKKGSPRKQTEIVKKNIDTLLSEKEKTEKEIEVLLTRKNELESTLPFLEDLVINAKELPLDSREMLNQLEENTKNVKELIEKTESLIENNKSLLVKLETALKAAFSLFQDLTTKFQEANPNVPLSIDELQSNVEKFLGEEGAKQYLEQKLGFTQLVLDFQETLSLERERLKVPNLERQAQELLSKLENSLKEVESLKNEQIAQDKVYTKFKTIAEKYEKEQNDLKILAESKTFRKEVLGTADQGLQTRTEDKNKVYEPANKKTNTQAIKSGKPALTDKPHHIRADVFGANLDSFANRLKIKTVLVSLGNEEKLGLKGLVNFVIENGTATEEDKKKIDKSRVLLLVMVEDNGSGTPVLVGVDGKPLATPSIDEAVFQTMPETLTWSQEYGGNSMLREGTSKEEADYYLKTYEKWKAEILNHPTLEMLPFQASFGSPQYVRTAEDKIDYDAVVTVEEAKLIEEKTLEDRPVIFIPTTNTEIVQGDKVFHSPLGRPLLKVGSNYVPLKNRLLTKNEADTIYKALYHLSTILTRDPSIGKEEPMRIINWLKTIIYWGTPKNSAGYNSVYIDFIDGDPVYKFSGKDALNVPITTQSLIENKDKIFTALTGMYNNVQSGRIDKTSGPVAWNTPYYEVVDIKEDGTFVYRKMSDGKDYWPNYQTYLLSRRGRSDEEIPLHTNIKPINETTPVNRRNIYFTLNRHIEEYKSAKAITPIPTAPAPKPAEPKKTEQKVVEKTNPIVNDDKTVNTINVPSVRGSRPLGLISFTVSEDFKQISLMAEDGVLPAELLEVLTKPATEEETKNGVKLAGFSEEKAKIILPQLVLMHAKELAGITKKEEPAPVPKVETTVAPPESVGSKPAEPSVDIDEKIKKANEEINNRDEDDDSAYRVAKKNKFFNSVKKENWTQVEKWLKENFPHIPVYRVKNIIKATNGLEIWGMLQKGAIYVYKNAEVGTVYHEVFESVWKMFTDPSEQKSVISEFKSRKGTFVDRPTGETIEYKNATDFQVKEQLAEEFRDYVLYKKTPDKPKDTRPFIIKLFSDIVSFIKEFFVGPNHVSNTEKLFSKIGTGYYKKYSPNTIPLSAVKSNIIDIDSIDVQEGSEYRIKTIPAVQVNDIMQHMTYVTLQRFVKNNESLFNIPKINKKELYAELQKNILNKIALSYTKLSENATVEEKAEWEQEFDKINSLSETVKKEWPKLIEKHEQYLYTYKIEFDEENDEATLVEEKSKEDPYGDATKIDSFKNANSAIKLLLSTLPRVDEKGNNITSSINGVQLLPTSQVFIALMNQLHTSRDIDDMLNRLKNMAIVDSNYGALYRILTKKTTNITEIENRHDAQLLAAFWRTFKKQSPDVKNVYIFDNGDVNVGDSNLGSAAKQLEQEFSSGIVQSIKSGKNPFFVYNKVLNLYEGKPDSVKKVNLNSIATYVEFLAKMGINFTEESIYKLSDDKLKSFTDAVNGIKLLIAKKEKIVSVSNQTLAISGNIFKLALIKAHIDNPEFSSTFFNVKGERTQSFIGTNPASDFYDQISQISNLNELKNTPYEYILTDPFSKNSWIIKKLFNEDGSRRTTTEPLMMTAYADGTVDMETGKKKQTSKLTYKERLAQEITLNLEGYYYNLVPGDASIQWMSYMGNHVSPETLLNSWKPVYDIFKGYFIDEVNVSQDNTKTLPSVDGRSNKDLRFFKSILGEEKHEEILKAISKISKNKKEFNNDLTVAEEVYKDFEEEINHKIQDYVIKQAANTLKVCEEFGIIQETAENEYTTDKVSLLQNTVSERNTVIRHLSALSVNFIINNIEQHKLLYSDPYLYEDELKRIKNFHSPRQAILHSSANINSVLNKIWNKNYKGIGETNFLKDSFTSTVLSDIVAKSLLPGYGTYKETDGSGIITFTAYRNFRIRMGEWSDAEESQYAYDIAFEKIEKMQQVTEADKTILKKGNPQVKSAYTPLKPIVYGNKGDGALYNDIILDKFALYPLSYRILKDLSKDGNVNGIDFYNKLQREKIDYAVFKSARKVSSFKGNNVYNAEGKIDQTPYINNVEIPFSIISVQSEVPSKDTNSGTRGSQVTKLVTMDFMEAGVPIDYMIEEPSFEKRYLSWLSDPNKSTPLYELIQENNDLLNKITEASYKNLLKKLYITEGPNKEYIIKDFAKTAKKLKKEMLKREVNDNLLDSFDYFIEGKALIEATPAYQQLRNVLYSLVDKEIVSSKITGGQRVQIPSSFLEKIRPVGEGKNYESDVLNFYKDEDGKRVCEIMIGRWFKSSKTDEQLLDHFYKKGKEGKRGTELTEEGKRLLSGIGFRIPTQKQNSIDVFVIKKFLPTEFGDSIVIPSALVKKAGSDFDIDKLSLYLKNIIKVKGFPQAVEYNKNVTQVYFKEKYTKELNAEIEKITNYYEFRSKCIAIFKRLEKAGEDSIFDATANSTFLGEEDYDFYTRHETLLDSIQDQAQDEDMSASEYLEKQQQSLEKKGKDAANKLLDEEHMENYADRMYYNSIQNGYIESMEKLVSHPLNFKNLIKPNSAKQLEDLAKEITKGLGFSDFDYSSTGNMLNRHFMSRLRHSFVTGKYAIGIAAVNQTNHALNQRQPIYIDPSRFKNLSQEDLYWLTSGSMNPKDIKVNFRHFNEITVNGKPHATFSLIRSKTSEGKTSDQNISDIIAQFIDGYVDISKGPWIMQLGATPNVASTWLTLIKLGVPIKEVAYFMNQPIIKDYLLLLEKSGTSWFFNKKYIDYIKESPKYEAPISTEIKKIPTLTSLKETLGKKELSQEERQEQSFILDEFIKYAKLSEQMFYVTQGSNFDTATINDPLLIFKKHQQYLKATKTIISSVDDLINNSFLAGIFKRLKDARDAFADILISEKRSMIDVIEEILKQYTDLNDKDFLKTAQKVVSEVFDYAVQVDRKFNSEIKRILIDETNTAQEVSDFVASVKANKNHVLYDNQVVNLVTGHFSTNGGPNNLKIKNQDNQIYNQNQLIYSFSELKNYLEGINSNLYDKLIKLAILQSGLSRSPISFTSMLPYEDFVNLYQSTLSKIDTTENLENFYKLDVFQRTNWNDDNIVPRIRAKFSRGGNYNTNMDFKRSHPGLQKIMDSLKIPKLLKLNVYAQNANSDIITYSWEKGIELLSEEEQKGNYLYEKISQKKKEMKKMGDYSYINRGLFKKVYKEGKPLINSYKIGDATIQEYIYKVINAWGDSHSTDGQYFSAKEYYSNATQSVINNGYIKVREMDDMSIIPYVEETKKQDKKTITQGTTEGPTCN